MGKGITITGARQPVIRSTTARVPGITIDLGKALGGEFIGRLPRGQASPVALLSVRAELVQFLRSTGGRPGLDGATRRQKIPLAEADWAQLQDIARQFSASATRATAGQIASVILHRGLRALAGSVNKAMKPAARLRPLRAGRGGAPNAQI